MTQGSLYFTTAVFSPPHTCWTVEICATVMAEQGGHYDPRPESSGRKREQRTPFGFFSEPFCFQESGVLRQTPFSLWVPSSWRPRRIASFALSKADQAFLLCLLQPCFPRAPSLAQLQTLKALNPSLPMEVLVAVRGWDLPRGSWMS